MLLDKPKFKQHPAWEPYAFETIEFYVTPEQEEKSEYAKFRKWLIEKEKEFVQDQMKKNEEKEKNPKDKKKEEKKESEQEAG